MVGIRKSGEKVRRFILDHVATHERDIVAFTCKELGITRQAVSRHLALIAKQGSITVEGTTRKRYLLAPELSWTREYAVEPPLSEDVVWRTDIAGRLGTLPDNVMAIWQYGFTEMFNNAIDHSGSTKIVVSIQRTAVFSEVMISDRGEGIFRKIQRELGLLDERHALLELAKGKLTTDPKRHTGEGIFFSSRMFDEFAILSGGVYFSHEYNKPEDWILERKNPASGTVVFMKLFNNSARTVKMVFDEFSSGDDYGFNKTIVPVSLARYGAELLVSRSQAKRLIARIDRFKTVIFDFEGVSEIGQAFADEIFRVFQNEHPEIQLLSINALPTVVQMIHRAQRGDVVPEEKVP